MELFYNSLVSLLFVLVGNFICGISPFFILKTTLKSDQDGCRKNRTLSLLIYFAGGAFTSTCLLILLPAANNEYEKHYHPHCSSHRKQGNIILSGPPDDDGHHESLPAPEFIILCGFLSFFILEEIFQLILNGFQKRAVEESKRIPFCSCAKRHTECSRTFKADDPTEQTLFGLDKQTIEVEKQPSLMDCLPTNRNSEAVADTERKLLQSSIISQAVPNYGAVATVTQPISNQEIPILAPHIMIGEGTAVSHSTNQYRPYITLFLLALVLSTHSLFQGLLLGYSVDSFTWNHLILCTLQFILSFSVGSIISKDSDKTFPVIYYIGLLSLMCPIGISIAMVFNKALASISHLTKAATNATVCGGLLYLTFFDLLRSLPTNISTSLSKFVCFILGAALITILQYLSILT